ncbi:MAG TPA: hypothetical protein DCL61_30815 [Cyanobacteria bacterium UBA12227]|nr:hypothetical protein [Cyanobacteria bacterium UBA12227]HAX87602.1 hypothetical protein [Cyanobacteria bacterium UBA11370]HBY81401.1 hypothetical protein [Cyanobacteria bacterium UBA11148]
MRSLYNKPLAKVEETPLIPVSFNNAIEKRSPLAPLKKGGTRDFLKVPLFKGDLGGSSQCCIV